MFESLNAFLSDWLGDASALGAASWLQAFAWMAALFVAGFAGVSLRRQSLQSRATLLLHLYERWESIETQRQHFSEFFRQTKTDVTHKHASKKNEHQLERLKEEFSKELTARREASDPLFFEFVAYMSFFETLGLYVRNGYVPLRDAVLLYKGPILDLELASRDFITAWQEEAHLPPGLLENALLLMERTRIRESRPLYYRAAYRIWLLFRR